MASSVLSSPDPDLDQGQVAALRNLEAKRGGEDVDYIRIADARALTDLGLAERTAQGWAITEAGSQWLIANRG